MSKFNNGLTLIGERYFYTEWLNRNDSAIARMLYDHSSDPEENYNISENKDIQEKINELSEDLKEKRGSAYIKE